MPSALHPHVALAAVKQLRRASGAIDADSGKAVVLHSLVAGAKSVPHPDV